MTSSNLALSSVPGGDDQILGGWTIVGVSGAQPSGVLIRLERPTDQATLQLTLTQMGTQALKETPLGSISYRKFTGISHMEAVEVARHFADLIGQGALPFSVLFPHLAFEAAPKQEDREKYLSLIAPKLKLLPGQVSSETGIQVLPKVRRKLHFDPPGIAEFFAPELEVDGRPISGYVLKSIYLLATGKREALDFSRYILDFEHMQTGESARLRLMARSGTVDFGHVGELSVNVDGFLGNQDEMPSSLVSLCSWVLTLVRLKAAEGLEIFVPVETSDVRAVSYPAGQSPSEKTATVDGHKLTVTKPPQSINLAIDTDCNQRCAFCSVKSYVKPVDHGQSELDSVRVQLRTTRQQGVEEVRLNGIDPLTFSHVLEVLDEVRTLGFRKLSVYSTCRRFADAQFRREFLRRTPSELLISVPLYGVTAETHEAVTGAPGSFAEVMTALEGLLQETKPGSVALSTVIVKQNLHEFLALVDFATQRGLALHGHMPYPMKQTRQDPYAESVARESTIVERVVEKLPAMKAEQQHTVLSVLGSILPHPCLLWEAERRTRLPFFGARDVRERPLLVGTEYRQKKFVHGTDGASGSDNAFAVATVACPNADKCALAPVCPSEHYAVYQQVFGLEEFKPVSVSELYTARPLTQLPRQS